MDSAKWIVPIPLQRHTVQQGDEIVPVTHILYGWEVTSPLDKATQVQTQICEVYVKTQLKVYPPDDPSYVKSLRMMMVVEENTVAAILVDKYTAVFGARTDGLKRFLCLLPKSQEKFGENRPRGEWSGLS